MIEDKLDHDERLRLECLALAVASASMTTERTTEIVSRAKIFENYVTAERPLR